MKKILTFLLKLLKWLTIAGFALAVLLLIAVEVFDRYMATDRGAQWMYNDIPGKTIDIRRTNSGLRYLSIGDADKKALVLVHGAPGGHFDWKQMASRADLYDHYRLLIVERPGYGDTQPRKAEPSVQVQAERLLEVLEAESRPATVLGHSYGGPVAVVMAALAPNRIDRVIGVSGQYDPDNEVTFSISYWIDFALFKYLLPRWIWVSNVEKLAHPAALRDVLPHYEQVQAPVLLIHGDADALVPYDNSLFLQRRLSAPNTLFTVECGDHPLQMQWANELVDLVVADVNPTTPDAGLHVP